MTEQEISVKIDEYQNKIGKLENLRSKHLEYQCYSDAQECDSEINQLQSLIKELYNSTPEGDDDKLIMKRTDMTCPNCFKGKLLQETRVRAYCDQCGQGFNKKEHENVATYQ